MHWPRLSTNEQDISVSRIIFGSVVLYTNGPWQNYALNFFFQTFFPSRLSGQSLLGACAMLGFLVLGLGKGIKGSWLVSLSRSWESVRNGASDIFDA